MKNVAIVSAHFDDEVLSCSGVISQIHPKNLFLIYTSSSDYVDLDGTIFRTKEQAIDERLDSLNELCGPDFFIDSDYPKIIDLDYPTKCVPYNSEIIQQIDRLFREYKINTVFCHSPSDTHSDHSNTGRAVFTAARRIPNLYTFEPIFPAQVMTVFQPNTYIDISKTYQRKINALKAQTSQYLKYGDKWLDAVDALSKLRGIECGCDRAECFTTIKQRIEL